MNESQPCECLSGSVDSRRLLEFSSLFVAANLLLITLIGIMRPPTAATIPQVILHAEDIEALRENSGRQPLDHPEENGLPNEHKFDLPEELPHFAPLEEGLK
jgi:hypothetical protein